MKRITAVCALLVSALFCVFSASTVSWEGRAAVGSSGIFPGRGMYGLSRVFSVGEIVEVFNPVNQTKITVVISNNTDLSGILILLSPEAADALGITAGSDSVVRVSKIPEYALEPTYGSDTYASPAADPDISPESAVAAAAQSEIAAGEKAVEEYRPDVPVEDVTPYVPEEKPAVPAIADVPPAPETADTASVTESLSGQVPAEDTVPVVVAEIPAEPAAPAESPLPGAEVPPLNPVEPEFAESTESVSETITYSLLPAEENPPPPAPKSEAPVTPPAPPPVIAAPPAPLVPASPFAAYEKPLQSGSWYVQLAYLKDNSNIRSITDRFGTKYPLVLNKLEGGYQVLVGPLSASEYSAVLNQFKNSGFKDAFAKKMK